MLGNTLQSSNSPCSSPACLCAYVTCASIFHSQYLTSTHHETKFQSTFSRPHFTSIYTLSVSRTNSNHKVVVDSSAPISSTSPATTPSSFHRAPTRCDAIHFQAGHKPSILCHLGPLYTTHSSPSHSSPSHFTRDCTRRFHVRIYQYFQYLACFNSALSPRSLIMLASSFLGITVLLPLSSHCLLPLLSFSCAMMHTYWAMLANTCSTSASCDISLQCCNVALLQVTPPGSALP